CLLPSCICSSFYWHGALRVLHSFPTRRSSDLFAMHAGIPTHHDVNPLTQTQASQQANGRFLRLIGHHGKPQAQRVQPRKPRGHRSEEHTSELQSRGHLVCRLLLEKKKKPNKNE